VSRFDPVIKDGVAWVYLVYDVGVGIDLDAAEKNLKSLTERVPFRHHSRAPKYFEFTPYPLRVSQTCAPLSVGSWKTGPNVELVVYDFGAVSVSYQIPLAGPFSSLAQLSELLYDNEVLLADARRLLDDLLRGMGAAVNRPQISAAYEDYVVFQVRDFAEAGARARLVTEESALLAQVLRADADLDADQEIQDALSARVEHRADDTVFVDWVSAIVFAKDADDTRTVLEFATVQLLELRHLDAQLDGALERYYTALSNLGRFSIFTKADKELREIGELQVESAVLFENINNAIKLLGDQYLARLYREAARRYHLQAWDASIERKLRTLESIYEKLEHQLSTARLEFIEWIVVILIAFEIVMPLFTRVYKAVIGG
jgi:hypothetical protein